MLYGGTTTNVETVSGFISKMKVECFGAVLTFLHTSCSNVVQLVNPK